MHKRLATAIAAVFCSLALMAQEPSGGVQGTIVSREGRTPVEKAKLILRSGSREVKTVESGADGKFMMEMVPDGMYDLVISAHGFSETLVNVTVNDGYVKNLFNISLAPTRTETEEDIANFSMFDMDDSGYNDNPTVLFGSNDVFSDITNYGWSAIRFHARGYTSDSQDVYLAGVKMNDAITGYGPWSLWSGLNEATRSGETTLGAEVSPFGFGNINGVSNIGGTAGDMRTGHRMSVLTNSAFYRLRLMYSYSTGELDNGWSFAVNVSARLGGNDWIKGVYYRSFGYYAAIGKNFNDVHRLNFVFMATPGSRGAQNGSTQEVYDLIGSNMYNSNWGWQDGKVRNARVRKTHEPITFLKYDFTPSDRFRLSATLLYRFGKNGYTALDWYDAQDPRPDYYRNLPSYFYMDNPDYNRQNYRKYLWAREAWINDYSPVTHIDWDRLYEVNRNSCMTYAGVSGNRSKYVQEERHVDQKDLNLGTNFEWKPQDWDWLKINGGFNAKINRTSNYKILADLLGGDYYINVDNFADRDFASNQAKVQNDLEYYLRHGHAQILREGDRYGYDYNAHVRNADGWLMTTSTVDNIAIRLGGHLGYTKFWREGLMRKGLFPGSYGDVTEINGTNVAELVQYDSDGKVISSYGVSEKPEFWTYGFKGNIEYLVGGKMRFYANAAWLSEAPLFNQAFIAPRSRNTLMPRLTNKNIYSADLNYQYSFGGYDLRLTGYYTKIEDQTDVMSFYDDLQNSFTNFAMSGIDQRYAGFELGFRIPTHIVENLSLEGAVSYVDAIYTSNPYMTQTVDNSSEVVVDYQVIPYWKSHPVFKMDYAGGFATDDEGQYIVDHYKKHHVSESPQFAASLGLSWNRNYWFIDASVNYFANNYLDMNPLYRTDMATTGPDKQWSPFEIEDMAAQEKFDPAWIVNASVGKSFYISNYQLGFNLSVSNLLNNTSIKTGGYEQTRLVDNTSGKERYYRFDPKYFYMTGLNYMMNLYFRF